MKIEQKPSILLSTYGYPLSISANNYIPSWTGNDIDECLNHVKLDIKPSESNFVKEMEENKMEKEIEKIEEQIALMKTYLLHKLDIQDFHGVYDCAIDMRCLHEKLQWIKDSIK